MIRGVTSSDFRIRPGRVLRGSYASMIKFTFFVILAVNKALRRVLSLLGVIDYTMVRLLAAVNAVRRTKRRTYFAYLKSTLTVLARRLGLLRCVL